jgi:hypothetical protein
MEPALPQFDKDIRTPPSAVRSNSAHAKDFVEITINKPMLQPDLGLLANLLEEDVLAIIKANHVQSSTIR